MAILEGTAMKLLNFDEKLDIGLLDNVVGIMYSSTGQEQRMAQEVLTTMTEHPDAWMRVDAILEYSQSEQTKFYALQILQKAIKTRWKVLPRHQCEGIRKYIVGLIIKISSDPESLEEKKMYLRKLNMILVQILKYEWPTKWPNFISDIVGAGKTNESLCQNNMIILKLLSEEVFDYSIGNMTQAKAKHMKESMCKEFSHIYHLCQFVMENSQSVPLVKATLETLRCFLNWIPLGYLFETDLITTLVHRFLEVPLFRNVTLSCLTEIASVQAPDYERMFIQMFTITMEMLKNMLLLTTNIQEAYSKGTNDEQVFIQNLSIFLSSFLKEHSALLEKDAALQELLIQALMYLLLVSEVEDVEIFKVCLEYWTSLCAELYRVNPFYPTNVLNIPTLICKASLTDQENVKKQLYSGILSKLRVIIISRMARPEEVLVVENEQGEIVREFMKDTDSIALYKTMRETLVYLTHLDYEDTEQIMSLKLQKQVDGTEWSWKNLNTLCWAIGSISGAMQEEVERRFLVTVIKELLGMCEHKPGKDNKAIIASNIMYVVGQYPRFLRMHWKFLKTVVNKLFEFMHETHDGVQDMACDTFIKIAQKCRKHFVQVQSSESTPFIEEIFSNINSIICDLNPQQIHTFYEAVGIMISSQTDAAIRKELIEKYMSLPNQIWDQIIEQATLDVKVLRDMETVRQLSNILKTNLRACKALGHAYVQQLGRNYLDLLHMYKAVSRNVNAALLSSGDSVTKQSLIKAMRGLKKDSLRLIADWIRKAEDQVLVSGQFVPPLLEAILLDCKESPPAAREPEVLSTLAVMFDKLESSGAEYVPQVLDAVFQCTLDMINKDFEEWPEHRTNLFLMLQALVTKCFSALLSIPSEQFKLILDSILWAIKHTMRNVADIGLDILYVLLTQMGMMREVAQAFYKTYYTMLLEHLFSVVTDSSQLASLSMISTILSFMLGVVENGNVKVPLGPNVSSPEGNVVYIQEFIANLLKNAFSHLNNEQIKVFVEGLIGFNLDPAQFKEHLRDFLVQIREYSGEDNSDLFLEEREATIAKAQEEKRRYESSVPGMLGPHELNIAESNGVVGEGMED